VRLLAYSRGRKTGLDTTPVSEVMSNGVFTCLEDDGMQQAARIVEEHQIRRLMVKNDKGEFVGMLTVTDLARHHETGQLLHEVIEQASQPGAAL
jgi:CBS domain-containing protein